MLNHRLEILVSTAALLPGYGNDAVVGPLEGAISDATSTSDYTGVIDHWNRITQTVIDVFGINMVSIVDMDTNTLLWKKPIGQVTTANVRSALNFIAKLNFDPITGKYTTPSGAQVDPIVPGTDPNGTGIYPGGCIFEQLPIIGNGLDFLCNFDKWLWLAGTAFLGYNALKAQGNGKTAIWAAGAAYTGWQAANRFGVFDRASAQIGAMRLKLTEGYHATSLEIKAIKYMLDNAIDEGQTSAVKRFKILEKSPTMVKVEVGSKYTSTIGDVPRWHYSNMTFQIS